MVGGECNIDLNDFFDAEGNEEGSNGSGEDSNGSGEGSHEENKPPVFTGELPRRELLELDDHQIDEMVKKKIQTVEDDLFNKAEVDKLAATIMPDGQVHVVYHGSNDGKYTTNDLLALDWSSEAEKAPPTTDEIAQAAEIVKRAFARAEAMPPRPAAEIWDSLEATIDRIAPQLENLDSSVNGANVDA